MRRSAGKSTWTCGLLILAGIVFGGFIGMLVQNVPMFSWLNYGQSFGLDSPIVLNLGIMILTFGLSLHITIGSIIGIILGIIVYRLL